MNRYNSGQMVAESKPKLFRRRWFRRILVLLFMAVMLVLATPTILSAIISLKLRSEISARLNTTLKLGKLTYYWPYGIRIEHARFIADDSSTAPLLEIGQLDLELANLPIGNGPLVIQKVDIKDPHVHLIRQPGEAPAASMTGPAARAVSTKKLSDLFELRSLTLTGGQVEYDDRRKSASSAPVIWTHLSADLRTLPMSKSTYQFQLKAQDGPLAMIDGAGTMDIDTFLLNISRLSVKVQARTDESVQQLPPQIQAICRKFNITGEVEITTTAKLPLNDLNQAAYTAQLSLRQGSCKLPDCDAPFSPVELTLSCSNSLGIPSTTLPTTLAARSPDICFKLSRLKIVSGNQFLQLDTGDGRITLADGAWAIGHILGSANLGDGPGPVHAVGIGATVPFACTGYGVFDPGTFQIRFGIDHASANFPPRKLPLNQITSTLSVDQNGVQINQLTGNFFDGSAILNGELSWKDSSEPLGYAGQLFLANINMKKLVDHFTTAEKTRDTASGTGELHLKFAGDFPPDGSAADTFTANGDFDIRHGHFLKIPVLKDVMAKAKNADAATVGEAAATFSIAHRRITFEQAAANAPAVGVQGAGYLDFDGTVNMNFVVTPLADWREKLASTDLPILSSIGAIIVGKTQNVINTAQRAVLYQYRITGPISQPKTDAIPAPVLTDAAKALFEKMATTIEEDSIVKELRQRISTQPTSEK